MGDAPPVTEQLVEKCYSQHPKELKFFHTLRNSDLDKKGIDFILTFKLRGRLFEINLQVKTSNRTLGLVLPLPKPLPAKLKKTISKRILKEIKEHCRKHESVKCILFVAGTKYKREEQTLLDIWRETRKIAHLFMRNHLNNGKLS